MKMVNITEQNIESSIRFDSDGESKNVEVTEFESVKVPESMVDDSVEMALDVVKNPWFTKRLNEEVQKKVDEVYSDPDKLAKQTRVTVENSNCVRIGKYDIARDICDDVVEDMIRKELR